MKKATVYVAYINSDLTEGRGYAVPLCVCKLKSTAIRLGKGKSVQGLDAIVKPVNLIEIMENNVAKWYAPVDECLNIVSPTFQDKKIEKENNRKERIIQKAKDLGLTEKEIKLLKE